MADEFHYELVQPPSGFAAAQHLFDQMADGDGEYIGAVPAQGGHLLLAFKKPGPKDSEPESADDFDPAATGRTLLDQLVQGTSSETQAIIGDLRKTADEVEKVVVDAIGRLVASQRQNESED